jgi:hypothetical protein
MPSFKVAVILAVLITVAIPEVLLTRIPVVFAEMSAVDLM